MTSPNIERIIADHGQPSLSELDAEISKILDRLRELQRRRVSIAMHIAIAEVCDVGLPSVLHAADDHDYTDIS